MRRMQPGRASCVPQKSSNEMPDLIEIAFQVGEHKCALVFGNAFFTREAGGTKREYARLDRLRAVPAVCLAEFKQANVSLTVIQVPLERRGHGHRGSRAHHR